MVAIDGLSIEHVATNADLRATDIGVTAMAFVFVALRFVSRWVRRVPIGPDDWLILLSLVSLHDEDV
jgi:hypothetical protein